MRHSGPPCPPKPPQTTAAELTDEQIDAVFAKWAGKNDHGAAYLRCYKEQFRHIARDVLALTTQQTTDRFGRTPEMIRFQAALDAGDDE